MPAFPLALLRLDGVGRVSAHRVLDHFDSVEAVRATPREQVILRLKGMPRAAATVEKLFGEAMDEALAKATGQLEALASKRIAVLTRGGDTWPSRLDDLPPADRPVALWAYGHTDALTPGLAILGRKGLEVPAFEAATDLANRMAPGGIVTLMSDGFDLAIQKPALGAGGRVVAVAACGLAKLEPSLRPGATALIRAGGCLVSPWPMPHGPFEYDEREAALVAAALAGAVVGAGVAPDAPEARALAWATEHRPTFALASGPDGIPVRDPATIAEALAL
ncbi:MAG: DNA-processing protein DprA [Bacteroidota bacterium]